MDKSNRNGKGTASSTARERSSQQSKGMARYATSAVAAGLLLWGMKKRGVARAASAAIAVPILLKGPLGSTKLGEWIRPHLEQR